MSANIILILVILMMPVAGFCEAVGQPANDGLDVLVLTNGAVVKGKILENVSGEPIKIEDQNGNVHKIPRYKVARISDSEQYRSIQKEVQTGRQGGWTKRHNISFGVKAIWGHLGRDSYTASISVLAMIDNVFSAGLSFGREDYGSFSTPALLAEIRFPERLKGRHIYTLAQFGVGIEGGVGDKELVILGLGVGLKEELIGEAIGFVTEIGVRSLGFAGEGSGLMVRFGLSF